MMRRRVQRLLNAARKLRAGLTLFGENISPEVPNDLFVAHLSIYAFAAPFAMGRRVLDLGCGAGYGSALLRDAGAAEVTGLDIDSRNIRYARRRDSRITFIEADALHVEGSFDLIVASNVLEHLTAIPAVLERTETLIVAVPPIYDEASLRENEAIPYHRSNFMITRWLELLQERFDDVRPFRHTAREGVHPDFGDPFPSRLTPNDFVFEEIRASQLTERPTITALFVASAPRRARSRP
jgi:SAM-dependent methyltransferase